MGTLRVVVVEKEDEGWESAVVLDDGCTITLISTQYSKLAHKLQRRRRRRRRHFNKKDEKNEGRGRKNRMKEGKKERRF